MKVLKNVQTERLRDNWSVIQEDNRAKCTESMSVDEIILEVHVPILTIIGHSLSLITKSGCPFYILFPFPFWTQEYYTSALRLQL